MWVAPESNKNPDGNLDWPGALLGILFLASLTLVFIEGSPAGWTATPVMLASACAVFALISFVLVERSSASSMLPLDLFRTPGFVEANTVAGLMNMVVLGTLFVLTLYLQVVQGRSALTAGVQTIPLFAPLSILAPFSGRLTLRIGPKTPMVVGLAFGMAGLLLFARLQADSSYLTGLLAPMIYLGVGMGFLTPAVVAAAMGSVPASRSGLASGVNNTASQAGGAIGVVLFGALAGSPGNTRHFIEGLSATALLGAGLWLVGITLTLIERTRNK